MKSARAKNCGTTTSWPMVRCASAIARASRRAERPASVGRSCHCPSCPRMRSTSRFSASGRVLTSSTAIVDFPLAGGPFRRISFATWSTIGRRGLRSWLASGRIAGDAREVVHRCARSRPAAVAPLRFTFNSSAVPPKFARAGTVGCARHPVRARRDRRAPTIDRSRAAQHPPARPEARGRCRGCRTAARVARRLATPCCAPCADDCCAALA